jgi:glutamyl-tRNA synthetase
LRLDEDQVQEKLNSGASYVIRFKTPQDQTLKLQDLIRGVISVDTNNLDDKVLFKSDGRPTYHLANVVDDHLMEISHVIRGEEWLPSLALHRLLYDALGWKPPEFAHLPLIMKPTGKGKLSKRDGDKLGFPVFPLNWTGPDNKNISMGYREAGYFPEAVINFLAFLGWNPGTEQEIFSLDELISHFDLTRVNKGGARFDPEKIQWYNHHYMQLQNNKDLASHFKSLRSELAKTDIDYIARVIDLIKERATFISDFWSLGYFFFTAPKTYDEKASKKAFGESAAELLAGLIDVIDSVQDFTRERLESEIKAWITNKNVGFGKVMMPLRLALVGALKGPEVFDIIFMIGRFETISRLKKAISVMPKTET